MKTTLAALCAAASLVGPALAAEPFYLGTWVFTAGAPAPWADAERRADTRERSRLLGNAVVIRRRAITGPQPFGCAGPRYKISGFPADMIFQGAFDEMRAKNRSADPARLATSLGFSREPIKTLETGCEIDFHFINDGAAEVALNDYVYTLKKQ